ncbi:MAG: HPr(Ser) kinase/phosphatase [Brevinematales bacterium]|nr:HPr(Ser) kinase/phosphatase [Brevinematales bacterium]
MTVENFVDIAKRDYNLDIEIITCKNIASNKVINSVVTNRPGLSLAGFFDNFAYDRVQIIGRGEQAYIRKAYQDNDQEKIKNFETFFSFDIPCCIVSDYSELPEEFVELSLSKCIPIIASSLDTYQLTFSVELILNNELAPRVVVNGGMFDIFGYGVLIIGRSGIGKSEVGLELLSRKHRFVSDDVVMIKKIRYPEGYRLVAFPYNPKYSNIIEVRGIGIINVDNMFGTGFTIPKKEIDIVIELIDWDSTIMVDRIGDNVETYEVLGIKLPKKTIPVSPGRNIPFLIETAIINERIKEKRIIR